MKTLTDVLSFSKTFAFYDRCNLERVIDLVHVRDCVLSLLNKCETIKEYEFIRSSDVIDNISLMIRDGKVKILVQEINSLRVGFLQQRCLDNLYKEDKGDVNGYHDKTQSFQKIKLFYIVIGISFECCLLRILLI